ncbi:hypothetical protein HHK36_000578 [Tetracentron sinense]|uniref:Peptidase A1 domain-containing protein n=1 Tax=Tetracentron sinense TaxID=13715 RepID=A0A835DTY4_TETSI|nr:hypothetical protein HHK36_000578 [Tetracentron sinense]
MKSRRMSLLVFFISINGFFLIPAFSQTMRFELIHRHSPVLSGRTVGAPKTRLELVKELIHSDDLRQQMITQKLGLRRMASEIRRNASTAIPLRSGADAGTGQYFVAFRVGSPSQKFMLIADTGSDLTWVNCKYRCRNCRKRRFDHRRIFHAAHSSSFKTVPCLSKMCKTDLMNSFSLARCPTPVTPCAYDYRYSDGSEALGFFAYDAVTMDLTNGRKMKLHGVLVGCSQSFMGRSFQVADGVMGLGYSKYSFAVRAAQKFGGKFSYCLVDHLSPKNVSNYLTFGGRSANAAALTPNIQHTELVLGVIDPFYAVNVAGISVGGVMLQIPSKVWDLAGGGGTILDSGSSLTFLTEPAYQPLMTVMKVALIKFNKVKMDIGPLTFCFNSTGFNEALMPKLTFHFRDGARFEPPVKSYVIDVADGVKCTGFVSTGWPGVSVIGNIMQQNHYWEFDLTAKKLGFAPSTCT